MVSRVSSVRSTPRSSTRFVVLLAAIACGACSSPAAPSSTGFGPDPYVTAMTDSGALKIEVRTSPQPPSRGNDTVELTISNASDGTPVDGLTLDVQPWMPSMNHGTSAPTIAPEGNGKYLVSNVYLFMAGTWQLRTTISGAATDHAEPAVEVP